MALVERLASLAEDDELPDPSRGCHRVGHAAFRDGRWLVVRLHTGHGLFGSCRTRCVGRRRGACSRDPLEPSERKLIDRRSTEGEDAMGTYVELGGVKTWYDEAGDGEPLVLLHGGIVTNETWGPQLAELPETFHVFAPERRGHGHTADVAGPFHYATMAEDTIAFLEGVVKEPAHLVGWSDGGIIGLLVAIKRPDLVKKLVAISANYSLEGVPEEMRQGLTSTPADADDMAMMRQLYEAASPDGPE